MKRKIIFLLTLVLLFGCTKTAPKQKQILAKINNYEITLNEFKEEFRESSYSQDNTPESRKEFLKSLIGRKLILQDAQVIGLDKQKDFLKMIERFWEQSLLKLALERKSQEIAGLPEVKNNKQGQDQLMHDWVSGLERKAKISVNYDLLK